MSYVTVFVLTYNHVKYIRQAVQSVLDQKTTFDFETVVIDDCSPDGTQSVLRELSAANPGRIQLVAHARNIRSTKPIADAVRACNSTYLAFLEGDDYWLSPLKLQKQIDYLDAHPEVAICFHNAVICDEDGNLLDELYNDPLQPAISHLPDLWQGNFIATCSAVHRKSAHPKVPAWYDHQRWGDWPAHLLAAQHGAIGYIDEVLAVYRRHGGGAWSGMSTIAQLEALIEFYTEMKVHFGGYGSQINLAMAANYHRLSDEHARNGDHNTARACLEKARELHRASMAL